MLMFFNSQDAAGYTIVRCLSKLLFWSSMTLVVMPLAVVNAGNYAYHHHDADAARVAGGDKDDGPIVPPAIKTPKA
jgi:hypothetical protein